MIDSPYIILSALLVALFSAMLKAPGFPGVFFMLSFVLVLIALALYDERYLHLPNHLLICLLLLSCINVIYLGEDIFEALMWGLVIFVLLLSMSALARVFSSHASIGMGDIKLLSVLALNLREELIVLLLLSCVLFAVVSLLSRCSSFAFGPYIVICWFIIYLGI